MKKTYLLTLIGAISLANVAVADVCQRSGAVKNALVNKLQKNCDTINEADLLSISDLTLLHIHLRNFLEDDFVGLTNLRKLRFFSLFHKSGGETETKAFTAKVFKPLVQLEELSITSDNLGELDDDVFIELGSLRLLRLSGITLGRLPLSLLVMPKIESVIYTGDGLTDLEIKVLKHALGDKLKASH